MKSGRVIFWVLFLSASLVAGLYFWNQKLPVRVNRYLRLMTHPNANVATKAWWDARELYFTKWEAYHQIFEHIDDATPIHFLVEQKMITYPEKGEFLGFIVENGRPIYYKSERVYCRTLGEAVKAIAYDEKNWKTPYDGDWNAWWQKNRGYYGK